MIIAKKVREASGGSKAAIEKFLFYFSKGFFDQKYIDWERGYKLAAHRSFCKELEKENFLQLLQQNNYSFITSQVIRIESRTNLLFSFEKMALRDALKDKDAAKDFAFGLYAYLYGENGLQARFEQLAQVVSSLPRKQTRVFTWPIITVFGFIGNPLEHIYLKPTVTKKAAEKYGYEFVYRSKPNWETYDNLLRFAAQIKKDAQKLKPKDYIDLQSFIWVLGSAEYPD
jgi:hypothetical protein